MKGREREVRGEMLYYALCEMCARERTTPYNIYIALLAKAKVHRDSSRKNILFLAIISTALYILLVLEINFRFLLVEVQVVAVYLNGSHAAFTSERG